MRQAYTVVKCDNKRGPIGFITTGSGDTPFISNSLGAARGMVTRKENMYKERGWYLEIYRIDLDTLQLHKINSDYTISEVVVVERSPAHIPYIYYVVLEGPRGNKIICDLFNIERLLFSRYNTQVMQAGRVEPLLLKYATMFNIKTTIQGKDAERVHPLEKSDTIIARHQRIRTRILRLNNESLFSKIAPHFRINMAVFNRG